MLLYAWLLVKAVNSLVLRFVLVMQALSCLSQAADGAYIVRRRLLCALKQT